MDNPQTEPIIREVRPGEAQKVIDYLIPVSNEPVIDLVLEPGELQLTVEGEEEFIRRHALEDNCLLIVAEANGEIIGLLNCTGGERRAERHVARLGISLRKDWRDRGVGRRMMEYAVEWGRGSGVVKRIELEVFVRNARGVHLYERVGFVTEGTLCKRYLKDGEYRDSLIMAILFED